MPPRGDLDPSTEQCGQRAGNGDVMTTAALDQAVEREKVEKQKERQRGEGGECAAPCVPRGGEEDDQRDAEPEPERDGQGFRDDIGGAVDAKPALQRVEGAVAVVAEEELLLA